jgi:Kef-type K+ transport system membrane component KefB
MKVPRKFAIVEPQSIHGLAKTLVRYSGAETGRVRRSRGVGWLSGAATPGVAAGNAGPPAAPPTAFPPTQAAMNQPWIDQRALEIAYLGLLFVLLLVPRLLQRFRIPAPLSAFVLGIAAASGMDGLGADPTLGLLATFGISSLFLFAGLEVEKEAFSRGRWLLASHLAIRALGLVLCAVIGARYLDLAWQVAALLGLALLTPSTGFILDTLGQQGLDDHERFWVAAKAVAGEILALAVLFVVVQSGSTGQFLLASGALLAILAGLPLLFVLLGRHVLPHAPGSEFSMLLLVGLVAAYASKQLGVYYLVGAFLTGVVAKLLHERMPQLASDRNLHAVRLFASFFVPFYFFHSGARVPHEAFQWQSLALGLLLSAVVLPARIGVQWAHRRVMFKESSDSSLRVAITLVPTFIFTLVLAGILRERFGLPETWYGALLVYAFVSTALPSVLRGRQAAFDPARVA